MTCQVGITSNPDETRQVLERRFPSLKNWEVFGPFLSTKEARDWLKIECKCSQPAGVPSSSTRIWYGYRFKR